MYFDETSHKNLLVIDGKIYSLDLIIKDYIRTISIFNCKDCKKTVENDSLNKIIKELDNYIKENC